MNNRPAPRRFRVGKEGKVFAAFMAVMFALLLVNRLTDGGLDEWYRAVSCNDGRFVVVEASYKDRQRPQRPASPSDAAGVAGRARLRVLRAFRAW